MGIRIAHVNPSGPESGLNVTARCFHSQRKNQKPHSLVKYSKFPPPMICIAY